MTFFAFVLGAGLGAAVVWAMGKGVCAAYRREAMFAKQDAEYAMKWRYESETSRLRAEEDLRHVLNTFGWNAIPEGMASPLPKSRDPEAVEKWLADE